MIIEQVGLSNEEFRLEIPKAYGVSISSPEGLLCIGGDRDNHVLPDISLLQWDAANKTIIQRELGPLPASFEAIGGALIDGVIYVSGILDNRNQFIRIGLSELLVQEEPTWKNLPANPGPPRRLMSSVAQSDGEDPNFYLFGGRANINGKDTLLTDAYAFNVAKKSWKIITPKDHYKFPMGAPALAYGASSIFLFGGDDGKLFLERSQLEQAIATAGEGPIKDSLQQQLSNSFKNHPGFNNRIVVYNTITHTIHEIDTLPGPSPVVTNAVLWNDGIFLPSGEIYPGVRTPEVVIGSPLKVTGEFGLLNYGVLTIYFGVLLGMGIYFSFRQKTTQDYFKGGGRIPWWAAGLSVFGTALSAITFMAIPAKTFATDWSYFLYNMSVLLATPVVVLLFIPFFRRLNVTTAYEYLEKRFNLIVRLFGSASFILFQVGRIGIVLYLPSIALALVTGIDIYFCIITMGIISMVYTLIGGIEAVIWTDVIQVVVLMGGALFAILIMFFNMNESFFTLMDTASAHEKFNIANLDLKLTEPTLWVVIIGGFFANLVTYSSDQTMVQRYLTTKDEQGAAKTAWTNAILVIPASLLFFGVGTALYLYYLEFPQKMDPFAQDIDAVFPWYIIRDLPNGISGLLIAGVFSAAMSSLSSSMNSISTAFTSDFYQRLKGKTSGKELLNVAKIATLVCGVLGTLLALWMATSEIVSLWDMFFKVLGLFTGGLGGLFLLGIISKQANGTGAIIGLVASSIVQYLVVSYTSLHLFLYAGTGLVTCVTIGHLASLVIKDSGNEKGKELTIYNKLFSNKSR